jgi:hypothetical protein
MLAFSKPVIELQPDKWTTLKPFFYRATDGSVADYPTHVRLMAEDSALQVEFTCEKDYFVQENHIMQHNEPLYNQEVFELFIAAGEDAPQHYLEFEINPNNAIWIGKISNPALDAKGISAQMVGYEESGIQHAVVKGKDGWSGSFSIPWRLISDVRENQYRINFYRIVSKKSQPEKSWVCNVENAEFLCWSPTMSGETPAFHRPPYFGRLILQQ